MLTHHKSYGTAESREGAMAAFKAEYERWLRTARSRSGTRLSDRFLMPKPRR